MPGFAQDPSPSLLDAVITLELWPHLYPHLDPLSFALLKRVSKRVRLSNDEYWGMQPHVDAILQRLRGQRHWKTLVIVSMSGDPLEQYMFLGFPYGAKPTDVARILSHQSKAIDRTMPEGVRRTILEFLEKHVSDSLDERVGKAYAKLSLTLNPIRQLAGDARLGLDVRHRVLTEPPAAGVIRHISQY